MEFEQLFIDGHNLPMPLSKEEVYDLLEKKQGRAFKEIISNRSWKIP